MKLFLRTKDYSVSKEEFDLVYKPELNMLVTQPQPKDLSPYYDSEAYISHTDAKTSFIDRLYQTVKGRNLKTKAQLIENQGYKSKSILDYGAGTGDFVDMARKRGFLAHGFEPNPKARAKADKKGIQLAGEVADLGNTKYDVITLWHVLEHIPNLEEQLIELREILGDKGLLVIAVPNYKSFDAKYYGGHWAAYDVPRHLWHFSRSSIHKLFLKHDMEVIATRPMLYDSFYVSLLSERYKGTKFSFIRAFCVGLWSNIHAIFSKEYSSVIYLIKKRK